MAVSIVTVVNSLTSATQGVCATFVDVSAHLSSNVTLIVAQAACFEQAAPARGHLHDATWDVCGASPQEMTTAGRASNGGNTQITFYQNNPNLGQAQLRIRTSGTAGFGIVAGLFALAGTDNTTPIDLYSSNIGSTTALGKGTSANAVSTANQIVIDNSYGNHSTSGSALGTISAETDQTKAYERRPGGEGNQMMFGGYQVGETSTRMSYDTTMGVGWAWSMGLVPVRATAAGGEPPAAGIRHMLTLIGAGR